MAEGKNESKKEAKAKTYTVHLARKPGEDAKLVGIDGVIYLIKRVVDVEVNEAVYRELNRSELAQVAAEDYAQATAQA